jgi:hypothetical protein
MVTVSFCLLPVIAAGHRFTPRERAVFAGVLHLAGLITTALSVCTSVVLTTMSIGSTAAAARVYGLFQNSKS